MAATALPHHCHFSQAVGDVNEVVITHDPDWDRHCHSCHSFERKLLQTLAAWPRQDQMPEIAEAIKQSGGEENCYAVTAQVL